jgi:hypothetical protein
MHEPAFIPTKPVTGATLDALGPPGPRHVLVLGSRRMASAVAKAGFEVTLWLPAPGDEGPHEGDDQRDGEDARGIVTLRGPIAAREFSAPEYDALVSVCALAGTGDAAAALGTLLSAVKPGGRVVIAERAPWSTGGRLLARLFRRVAGRPVAMEPAEVAAICLQTGVRGLRQAWPQGLRSLVLTSGYRHPLARTLAAE